MQGSHQGVHLLLQKQARPGVRQSVPNSNFLIALVCHADQSRRACLVSRGAVKLLEVVSSNRAAPINRIFISRSSRYPATIGICSCDVGPVLQLSPIHNTSNKL